MGDEYGSEKQVDAIVSQVSGPASKEMVMYARHTPHKEAAEYTLKTTSLLCPEFRRDLGVRNDYALGSPISLRKRAERSFR